MAPRLQPSRIAAPTPHTELAFNADAAAIVIALLLAALVRFGVLAPVGW